MPEYYITKTFPGCFFMNFLQVYFSGRQSFISLWCRTMMYKWFLFSWGPKSSHDTNSRKVTFPSGFELGSATLEARMFLTKPSLHGKVDQMSFRLFGIRELFSADMLLPKAIRFGRPNEERQFISLSDVNCFSMGFSKPLAIGLSQDDDKEKEKEGPRRFHSDETSRRLSSYCPNVWHQLIILCGAFPS